ncbi:patatin-like phospholipase family protein [Actinomadura atramentaria]|uniref:patatin-like phospholipase family protein n=1 Tax=Actinomadura atramentaria TaxID=1990 RepID=UPI000366BB92|nr:patatin-like phospholipase family protein [Actinomadura atramentaria]
MGRALVLGGGGVAGIAWEAGLVEGFRRAGADLGAADLFVGTSAGSVVGAFLAHGADLAGAIEEIAEADRETAAPDLDPGLLMKVFEVLTDTTVSGAERRRRAGVLALETDTSASDGRLDEITERLPSHDWPERRLLATAVDVESGALTVWQKGGAATLPQAVISSCSVPGIFPPVEIAGRRYMDGGVYSATNADLAVGNDRVVVLEPMAHLTPRAVLEKELAALHPADVAVVGPDDETIELFALDLLDPKLWTAAYAAGVRQAASQVPAVAGTWNG